MANILVVEDEERMRHLIAMMLKDYGHQVDEASDGEAALEMIENIPYDLVITDIKMPGMDGMELFRTLRENNILCPLIFITAFATIESAVEAMRDGAVDYITKPFEEERLLLTVERTLGVSRILAENRELQEKLQSVGGGGEIVYKSNMMAEVLRIAKSIAERDSVV